MGHVLTSGLACRPGKWSLTKRIIQVGRNGPELMFNIHPSVKHERTRESVPSLYKSSTLIISIYFALELDFHPR